MDVYSSLFPVHFCIGITSKKYDAKGFGFLVLGIFKLRSDFTAPVVGRIIFLGNKIILSIQGPKVAILD